MLKPSQIEARAKELLEKCKITAPHVEVRKIARDLGVQIKFEPSDGDISGVLTRDQKNKPVIGVNEKDGENRQRFTIAHEIGHLVLHSEVLYIDSKHQVRMVMNPEGGKPPRTFLRDQVSSEATDYREIEANRFAASLLMPQHLLAKDLKLMRELVTWEQLDGLATRYKVSTQAMTFRLMNLGVPVETL